MSCSIENREEKLLDYVSGSLGTLEAAQFAEHLETCSACSEFVRGQQSVWDALDVFEPAPVSANFDRRLYERIAQTSWWSRLGAAICAPFRGPMLVRQGLPIAAAAIMLATAVFVWERPASIPAHEQSGLSAEVETLQADQVQRALDDMEMLREFNHAMRPEPAQSKM